MDTDKAAKTRILALDYGVRRIGVALSDETNTIAFGKDVLVNDDKLFEKISRIVRENKVGRIVIGYPLSLKGGKTAQTIDVEKFELQLNNFFSKFNLQVDIVRCDERFTSKMAQDSMLHSGMKKKKRQDKSNLDIISASLILQSYLDSMKRKMMK